VTAGWFLPAFLLAIFICTFVISKILGKGTTSLVFLLVFSTFSGYLNNLYDRQPIIHVARFAILGLVGAHWLLSRSNMRGSAITPLDKILWTFFAFYTLQMFNPHWSSIKVAVLNGFIGMASHGVPILLFFIGREVIRTPRQIEGLFHLLVGLSVVMAIYGLYQYEMGYEYVASLGAGFKTTLDREMYWTAGAEEVHIFRPVSFAPDAGTASSFYAVGILLAASLLTRPRLSYMTQLGLVAAVGVQFLGLALTMVRSSMVGTFVGLAVVLFAGRKALRTGAAFLLLAALVACTDEPTSGVFLERFQSGFVPEEIARSRGLQFKALWWALSNFPTGMGIGRGGPAGGRFNAPEDDRYNVPPESYFVCLIFETGIIGFLLAVYIFYLMARFCCVAVLRIRDPVLHPLAIATSVVLCAAMVVSFAGPTLYTAPLCYLFWTLAGLLFRLIELEQTARRKFTKRPRMKMAVSEDLGAPLPVPMDVMGKASHASIPG
jgi:hypothetical protein